VDPRLRGGDDHGGVAILAVRIVDLSRKAARG